MDEQQAPGTPQAEPALLAPPQRRGTAGDAPPRAGCADELDALLRDVEVLRQVLGTDLSLAASAAELGAVHVAVDVVDADRDELSRFSGRALARPGAGPHRTPLVLLTALHRSVEGLLAQGPAERALARLVLALLGTEDRGPDR